MTSFFRFPHTPHLIWLGSGQPRDDKVLPDHQVVSLLSTEVIVEEKLDGANLGISLDQQGQLHIQNRGQYLEQPYVGQFSRLTGWLGQHSNALKKNLTNNLILFGEWCTAKHSLHYDSLPDWFLLFDVYDKTANKFWSVKRRNPLAHDLGIAVVPPLASDHYQLQQIVKLLEISTSHYHKGAMEGIVLRKDSAKWNLARAKLVNTSFSQAIDEHWRGRSLEWNRVKYTNKNDKR